MLSVILALFFLGKLICTLSLDVSSQRDYELSKGSREPIHSSVLLLPSIPGLVTVASASLPSQISPLSDLSFFLLSLVRTCG